MHRFIIFILALFLSIMAATDKNQKLKEQELKILREQLNLPGILFKTRSLPDGVSVKSTLASVKKIRKNLFSNTKPNGCATSWYRSKKNVTQSNVLSKQNRKSC